MNLPTLAESMKDSDTADLQPLAVAENSNPMRKIILMVSVAILVFIAFMIYSLQTSVKNGEQLSAIKDLYFPILERVDANIVRLDKIEEKLMQGVMTGERDELDNAAKFYQKSFDIFEEMGKLYPGRANEIGTLRDKLIRYFEFARKNLLSMLEQRGADNSAMSEQMNHSLNDLRQGIHRFRDESYGNFVSTLLESQKTATINLYMGIAVGVMNLFFMVVLVYFIRNNVKMMAVIAEQNATLEHRVAERTAQLSQKTNDINAMLQNMSLGVCTVVPGNRIHHEYSAHLSVIFGNDEIANQDVLDCLFRNALLGVDGKDQVSVALGAILGEDAMMFDFNGHLLVREMQLKVAEGPCKTLQMSWSPILNENDVVDKVLLIVQDVTELRALELASAQQKEELDIISQIINVSIGKFNDFIASAQNFAAENRKLIQSAGGRDPEVVAALFRNMHTIKGNARTYEFTLITNAAHAAEHVYDCLRKDAETEWNPGQLLEDLEAVQAAIDRYVDVNEGKLGRKGRASDLLTTRGIFISNNEIEDLKTKVAELAAGNDSPVLLNLQKNINHLGLISLDRLVTGAMDSVSSLAKELNKPEPTYRIAEGDIAFTNQFAQALKSSFMHIVRNSLDHGIEPPEERRIKNKPSQGVIDFRCQSIEGRMELHISDDGRGLALHKLYEKALAAGEFQGADRPSPETVAELIFKSGCSTAEAVTQVSGRGVGMDAVRSFLKNEGASVRILLDNPGETFGFTPFKFVITFPAHAFSQ
ncbi:Hpt domain-containing protein [Gammaproteobacteria bacterium]